MDQLRCVIERITFFSGETGFCVLQVRVKSFTDLVTLVGNMVGVHVGAVLTVDGIWKNSGQYGRQFTVERWEESLPATVYGIEKYLGSGLIKGVGPKYAKKIVSLFGKDTIQIIEEEPDRLIEVSGIGSKRVAMIKAAWETQKEIKNIMLFLQSHDVSTAHAAKIYKQYGADSIKIVQENPYRLADDIQGIGFITADKIAQKLGFDNNGYARCRSGILYALGQLADEGHCFAYRFQLIKAAIELLGIEENIISMTLDHMLTTGDLIKDLPSGASTPVEVNPEGGLPMYLPPFFFSEAGVAKRIAQILHSTPLKGCVDPDDIANDTSSVNKSIEYDELQLQAIQAAASSKVMVLTGGPGTGKTTTVLGMLQVFEQNGMQILLAAPTGRAAKRMTESTGMEAKTIHRLLEYKPQEGYHFNDQNKLIGDVLIVDEVSMIDVILMYNLLKAVPDTMKVIFVGDVDQLPSIGAGNILRDIIASDIVPVVQLTHIFRQAAGSQIIQNAHRVNKGLMPDMQVSKDGDFFFMEEEDPDKTVDLIVKLCKDRLPQFYKVNPIRDIQVLTPMQKGILGARNLNTLLQDCLNPKSGESITYGDAEYRAKDKVMQIKNNYDKEVFNGDIGFIREIDLEERELTISFDERSVKYDSTELDEVTLAYACTVHKAQGSEYPIVVMPATMKHFIMLQRNLIYTGMTRAKKILVMIGTKKALGYAIRNNEVVKRNTMLKERLITPFR